MPFSTKEPEVYQADIVISFPLGDVNNEQKYFVARDGETRRTDYQLSDKETLVLLEKPDGKTLILLPNKKCATENAEDASVPGNLIPSQMRSLTGSLTTAWLAEEIPANFADLGKEEINGKALAKFRVRFEKRGGVESASEALVWVDTELGMPVKTELYAIKNEQQLNKMVTEFRNLKLSVEPGVFDLPAGCQNIPFKEMQKLLRQERLSAE